MMRLEFRVESEMESYNDTFAICLDMTDTPPEEVQARAAEWS